MHKRRLKPTSKSKDAPGTNYPSMHYTSSYKTNISKIPLFPYFILSLIVTASVSFAFLLLHNSDFNLPLSFSFKSHEEASHAVTRATHPELAVSPLREKKNYSLEILSQSAGRLPTIVVQLRGELGNHLSSIAHGRGIQLYALEVFGLETNLLLRHQVLPDGITSNPKWEPTKQTLQRCFNFSDWDFSRGGRWKEFDERRRQQERWLDFLNMKKLDSINGRRMNGLFFKDNQPIRADDIDRSLETFLQQLSRKDRPTLPLSAKISLPFLLSESLDNNLLVDRYYGYFQNFFKLDQSCCGNVEPEADESVFHFRNFETEMPNHKGTLQEGSPNQTAFVLFGHLQAGDKVAIATRFNNANAKGHADALKSRGIQVRILEGQTGVQDFCFLTKAQKELVGNYQSSFAFWAAVLGKARKSFLYTLDSPSLRDRFDTTISDRFEYQWENEELKARVTMKIIEFDPVRNW
eukprot:scaffold3108_cov152-Cylindrotheca_fusiformis.AAC.10